MLAAQARPPGLCAVQSRRHLTIGLQLASQPFLFVGEIAAQAALTKKNPGMGPDRTIADYVPSMFPAKFIAHYESRIFVEGR
jgi:hypothetical protein